MVGTDNVVMPFSLVLYITITITITQIMTTTRITMAALAAMAPMIWLSKSKARHSYIGLYLATKSYAVCFRDYNAFIKTEIMVFQKFSRSLQCSLQNYPYAIEYLLAVNFNANIFLACTGNLPQKTSFVK